MSIPLDNLYHYIESVATEIYGNRVIIYRFWPHGAKKLENLQPVTELDWYTELAFPHIICNDQEILDFDFYQNYPVCYDPWQELLIKYNCFKTTNLNFEFENFKRHSMFDHAILLHSEQRSHQVKKYQDHDFIPVYYWSHAMISLDWFRFARHLEQNKKIKKTFLIYNRAWTGTREYRIKFCELLQNNNLVKHCQTTFNKIDPESQIYYKDYNFKNSSWIPKSEFSGYFDPCTADSTSSARLDWSDYETTEIEVVLETLFDDPRLHFTEKILRPIAIGQPFILAGGYRGLEYLKYYGFKTFESVWDESYDVIKDPYLRLKAIIDLMISISQWDPDTKKKKIKQAQKIAKYNKKYFFSKNFFCKVNQELHTNLTQGINELLSINTSSKFLKKRKLYAQHDELRNILTGKVSNPLLNVLPKDHPYHDTCMNPELTMKLLSQARQYYLRSLSQDNKKQ